MILRTRRPIFSSSTHNTVFECTDSILVTGSRSASDFNNAGADMVDSRSVPQNNGEKELPMEKWLSDLYCTLTHFDHT